MKILLLLLINLLFQQECLTLIPFLKAQEWLIIEHNSWTRKDLGHAVFDSLMTR